MPPSSHLPFFSPLMSPFISLLFFHSFVSSRQEQGREVHFPPNLLLNSFVGFFHTLFYFHLHQTDGQTEF